MFVLRVVAFGEYADGQHGGGLFCLWWWWWWLACFWWLVCSWWLVALNMLWWPASDVMLGMIFSQVLLHALVVVARLHARPRLHALPDQHLARSTSGMDGMDKAECASVDGSVFGGF
uniref:Candidate secreted effector n=1 Tax=Meloidogyne incognita TaxID=6306 RepID=A0A914LN75_MELIC